MDFTDDELKELAGFVCQRFDDLTEIAEDPNPRVSASYKSGARAALQRIESLNNKLRPYFGGS